MLDLHMHILPGLDDGAESWEEAMDMAMIAVDSGTKGIAATSHGNIDDLTIAEYAETFFEFRERLQRENIPLMVYPGMEIFMTPEATDRLVREELLTLNNSRYTLVEFDFGEDVRIVEYCLKQLVSAGFVPVIAHAERYVFVQRQPELVYEWAERGFVIQANKGSFTGAFGRRVQDTAMMLLRHNLVHIAASDAHSARYRTPSMGSALRFLSDYISEEYQDLLFEVNPRHILRNEEIKAYRPIPFGRHNDR